MTGHADYFDDADKICLISTARRLIGEDAAKALHFAYSGQRIYIPRPENLAGNHGIVMVVGWQGALRLAEAISGVDIDVPTVASYDEAEMHKVVMLAKLAGLQARRIASLTSISDRHVRFIAAKLRNIGRLPPQTYGNRYSKVSRASLAKGETAHA